MADGHQADGVSVKMLPLSLGLSLVATGLLGMLAVQSPAADRAVGVSEVDRVPLGTRLLVRGLLERVAPVGTASAVATLSDCASASAPLFFPRGVSPAWSFTLVTVEGVVQEYNGKRELVVDDLAGLHLDVDGALAVTPAEIAHGWQGMLCREVGFTGNVAWARVVEGGQNDVEVGVAAPGADLLVLVHLEAFPALRVEPGAAVTFLGTVAAHPDGSRPIVHVRA